MQFIAKVKCEPLRNYIFNNSIKPIRITVYSGTKPPERCIGYVNIVNAVTNTINTSVHFYFNGNIGKLVEGKWNGAIGQVVNNKSDLAIGQFTVTDERFQATQPSTPLGYSSPIAILSGRISQHSMQNKFQVFNTFSSDVWLLLFLSVLMIGLINYFVHNRTWKFSQFISSIIQSYKCVLAQSVKQFSRVCCSRHMILIGMSLISLNFLIHCFKNLILTNLLSDPLLKIDSIDDLVNFIRSTRENITLISSRSLLTWQLFKNSEDENFRTIFRQLKEQSFQIKDIINGKMVLILYGFIIERIMKSNQHASLYMGRQQYFGSPFAILYAKSFDKILKEKIDSVISIIFESGLYNFWTFLVPYKRLDLDETKANDTITMDDMKGIIMLLATIYLLVILFFMFENLSKISLKTKNTIQTNSWF